MPIRENLKRMTARTGKLVDSAGNIINQANAILREEDRTPDQASRDGKLYRAFWAGTIPTGETYDFVIQISTGREIYGVSRQQNISGEVDVEFWVGGTVGTVISSATGYNFDETLAVTSVCTLDRVDAVTGASQRASGFVRTSTSGATAFTSAQTIADTHPKFDETRFPVFRYTNTGSGAARLDINLVWQEIPI